MKPDQIADAIRDTLQSSDVPSPGLNAANVVDALAMTGDRIASALRRLGNADASTPLGGMEGMGMSMVEAAKHIAKALDNVADAIREHAEKTSTTH